MLEKDAGPRLYDYVSGDKGNDEQYQKYNKENSGKLRSRSSDTAKSKRGCNQRYQQKYECIVEHYSVASRFDA